MELKLDLHVHSAASPDGRMTIPELVAAAKAAGLDGVAVCDHDRVWEGEEKFPDFLLIPGVEWSTEYGHLLGLFVSQPMERGSFAETAERIRAQGGLAVLAHPFERSRDPGRIAPIAPLLDGVEVWNGRAERKNRAANAMARIFAENHGLRPFAGSDAHVPQELGNGAVTLEVEEATAEAVKAALLHGRVKISGRRGRARYVAMSQYTKRKKTGASAALWVKWGLFALKCCAEDLFRA